MRLREAVLMVVLDGASLTIDSLAAVAEGGDEVALAPAARERMTAAREIVEEALRSEAAVYGLTTALAERKSVVLDAGARQGFSRFLIRGHLIAQGSPAPPPVVRAAMVCLVNGYAKGAAGVRPELAEMLVELEPIPEDRAKAAVRLESAPAEGVAGQNVIAVVSVRNDGDRPWAVVPAPIGPLTLDGRWPHEVSRDHTVVLVERWRELPASGAPSAADASERERFLRHDLDPGHARQVRRDHRGAGRHRLEQLVGGRQAVVEGRRLDRHRDDIGGRDPVDQLGRRNGGQDVQAATEGRVRGAGPEGTLQRAVAEEYDVGLRLIVATPS
jgi:hypothetical protein